MELTRALLSQADAAFREILGNHGLGPDGDYRGTVSLTGGTLTFATAQGEQSMPIPARDNVGTISLAIRGQQLTGKVLAGDAKSRSQAIVSGSFDPATQRLAPTLGKFELAGDYEHPLVPLETLGGRFRLQGTVTSPGQTIGGDWRLQLTLGGFAVDARGTWTASK